MIKNNGKATQYLLTISLCLLIFSCKKEEEIMGPGDIYGSWTSGELSYHLNLDCSGEGMTLEEFADSVMINNLEMDATFGATALCLYDGNYFGQGTLELCIEDRYPDIFLGLEEDAFEDSLHLDYQTKITSIYSYDDMDLIIFEGTDGLSDHYSITYDGECMQTPGTYTGNTSEAGCNTYDSVGNQVTEWNGTECIMIAESSCVGAGGEWDNDFYGGMNTQIDSYTLEDFFGVEGEIKEIIFDGYSIFLIMNSSVSDCICGESGTIDSDLDGIDCIHSGEDCILLEEYCVSYNFTK